MTPARLRPRAEADLIERSRYYAVTAGADVGSRFFDTSIAALRAVELMSGSGSPHIGELCGIPELRVRRIQGFPCGWFYFVRTDHLDVVRLLADTQDLAAILANLDDEP